MDDLPRDFLTECAARLDATRVQLSRLLSYPSDAGTLAIISRNVSAIKRASAFPSIPVLERIVRSLETGIDQLLDGARPTEITVAFLQSTIDDFKTLPPTLAHCRLGSICDEAPPACPVKAGAADSLAEQSRVFSDKESSPGIASPVTATVLQRLSNSSTDLQTVAAPTRMLPLERLFADLQGLVRNLSSGRETKVELWLRGGGVALDRHSIESIRAPLTELVRNAVEHAIESPPERRRSGKPSSGRLRISARRTSGAVVIDLRDDGRGLNAELIRERAYALGRRTSVALAEMSEADLFDLVFAPDFDDEQDAGDELRTCQGLSRIRAAIDEFGGSISMASQSGRGTVFTLTIPLKRPVSSALIFRAGGERLALPQHLIEEIIEIEPDDEGLMVEIDGILTVQAQKGPVPIGHLDDLIRGSHSGLGSRPRSTLVLRLRSGVQDFAVVIDEILDIQEIALDSMPTPLKKLGLFSGAARLGDGSIVLALDPAGAALALQLPESPPPNSRQMPELRRPTTNFVVFRSGGSALRALPVAIVNRVERLGPGQIDYIEGACSARISGEYIPLFRLGLETPADLSAQQVSAFILEDSGSKAALVVDEVIDIVEGSVQIELSDANRGILGSAEIRGRATEILDPHFFLELGRNRQRRIGVEPAPPCVLLIEPDAFFRDMIAQALVSQGYEARVATGLSDAVDAVGKRPAVGHVLVDLDSIGDVSDQFARAIQSGACDEPPVLIGLAAHDGSKARSKARRAGLVSAIGKFDRAAILAALRFEGEFDPAMERAA